MSIRCPVCGVSIQPESVPTFCNSSFHCPRCHTQLEVASHNLFPMFALSLGISSTLCILLGLRGLALIFAIAVSTAMIYWLGGVLRSVVSTPKLRRSPLPDKPTLINPIKRTHIPG
jgi:hypothetical protein